MSVAPDELNKHQPIKSPTKQVLFLRKYICDINEVGYKGYI